MMIIIPPLSHHNYASVWNLYANIITIMGLKYFHFISLFKKKPFHLYLFKTYIFQWNWGLLQDYINNFGNWYSLLKNSAKKNKMCSFSFQSRRTTGDILELVEQSLDYNLVGSHVRYRFQDTPLLGGTSVHEHQGKVIILVTTVASVHRLVFPHPNKIHRPVSI